MKRNWLIFSLIMASACSFTPPQVSQDSEILRDIASSKNGISYPSARTFKLEEIKGKTYITFLKNTLKPAMDKLSDKNNGGGGGFDNIGSAAYTKQNIHLNPVTLAKYKGAKWNRTTRTYQGAMSDDKVVTVYETLKSIKPRSTIDSIGYYDRNDKEWFTKNDMALALKEARINAAPFDLATLYALTGGIGVKVKIDDKNFNYHVLYKTGKTQPHVEVMSGRSFASAPGRGVADATDPEYLKDLQKYLKETRDQKPFYRTLILSLANSDPSGWKDLSSLGQAVLSDFYTVYTAEAIRHLMVNLKYGVHPWEIDLAAVTVVSSLSAKLGQVVQGGALVKADLGAWFAPSPNNVAGGPQRSGIGITRKDRKIFQKAIHKYEINTARGKDLITKIHNLIGKRGSNDVIQAVFEHLSNNDTPVTMGDKAEELATSFAEFIELAREDAEAIAASI